MIYKDGPKAKARSNEKVTVGKMPRKADASKTVIPPSDGELMRLALSGENKMGTIALLVAAIEGGYSADVVKIALKDRP